MAEAAGEALFRATIVPHRSLSRGALLALGGAIVLGSAAISGFFWIMGAWPVAGFGAAEVGAALLLLHVHARGRRASEVLILEPDALRILRTDPRGRTTERRLSPDWLAVHLQERPGRVPALHLLRRGVAEEVAAELGETEKRAVADALRAALHRHAAPRFDNPQLRD